ncbi:D-beta-hydroxybutyrate dehydrogenase [Magallana gigas]|uniref:D-beta-hydroxybutyrate dehydrogenase n=1 Tax=Magallana gigas TaxID=29159 RepID=UPI0033410886
MTLEGKTAHVVGFAGAIGSSIATSLANAGCDIIGVDKAKQDSVHISIDKIKESRLSVSKIEELPDDNWEDDITVNLTAPFMVIKQLLGSMKEKGWRRIIHISTICGLVALRNVSSYIASKSGLIGLTRDAARLAHPTKQFTEVDQIADLVLFLCSPAGKNMTGTAIPMDGGITVS